MKLAERMLIWTLAKGIHGGRALAARWMFDEKFAHRSAEWRQDVWRQAAERAERIASH